MTTTSIFQADRGVLRTRIRRIHFVGIGGIGMSGIAEVLLTQGFAVSGSDISDGDGLRRLARLGAQVFIGHREENLGDADVLVYSSIIPPGNPEYREARRREIPIIQRAEMLAELMRMKDGVAVAGSHGKTTTTSLLSWILAEAGLDPTCLVGGRLESFDSNARLGESRFLVAEADESDGSFLMLSPVVNVITNIDPEHMEHYKTFDHLVDSFVAFANRVPFYGSNIMCIDHPVVRDILPRLTRRHVTYGLSEDAEFRATDIHHDGLRMRFTVWHNHQVLGDAAVPMPGRHNVQNSLAAIACASELGIGFETTVEALSSFKGIDRRFQIKGTVGNVTVVDDYGHHPEEIKATLRAAKNCGFARSIVLFQPHRYTRTRDLFEEFAQAFADADELYVVDIYPASEAPIPGVTAESLVRAIVEAGHANVRFVSDKTEAASLAAASAGPHDLLLTLGAGDIKAVGPQLLAELDAREGKEPR
jgi:UDP-N-acetylmuramate--alanine ligase